MDQHAQKPRASSSRGAAGLLVGGRPSERIPARSHPTESSRNAARVVRRGDHAAVRQKFEELRRTGDPRLRCELIAEHQWIASLCCRRFAGRGEQMADLTQVAQLGIVQAVDRYDPSYGVHFATFAVPTVMGELRRHFRDSTWPVRVPRRVKELHLQLSNVADALQQDLGRPARVDELAAHLGATVEEVRDAIEANMAYRLAPLTPALDLTRGEAGLDGGTLCAVDESYDRVEASLLVRRLLATLPERERRIVELRFFEERSQVDIAREVGLSQVHVSRTLRNVLDRLHVLLNAADRR